MHKALFHILIGCLFHASGYSVRQHTQDKMKFLNIHLPRNSAVGKLSSITAPKRYYLIFYFQATTKLDEIEIQVECTDLTSNTAALAERLSYLSHSIVEAVTPAFHEGHALLERVGKSDPGTQGVSSAVRKNYRQAFFSIS